jgi:3-methyladenine DNA glycosylase AlkD
MHNYLNPLKMLYQQAANPVDAAFMKKYLLNQFEFFGIRAPAQKEIRRGFFKAYGLPEPAEISSMLDGLWQQPEREFQYFGIDLSEKVLKKMNENSIESIEFMIVNKPWWDTVDWIASHHAGTYFKMFPHLIHEKTGEWMNSGNMWLQRSVLLFQLKYKTHTDRELLFSYIRQLKDSKEFFIRKAIGWALREYSKTSPEAVKNFVENTELSGLSRREALKWLERKKQHEQD